MGTGKARDIRAPHKWTQPAKPIVQAGPTFCIKVPAGSPGSTIQVPHPKDKRQLIAVNVPAGASEAAATAPVAGPAEEKKSGWSTGAKVAAGGAALVGVGGLAVAGAVLGEHIAEEGWDATMAELGDAAADAGEAIGGAAEDAGRQSPVLQRMRGNGSLALQRMLETSSWTFSKAGGSR